MTEPDRKREEERLAERKAARKRRKRMSCGVGVGCSLILLIILIAVVALGVRLWQVSENTRAMEVSEEPAISLSIPEGAGVREIGTLLEDKGVISNGRTFYIYCKLKGEGRDFKAGTHNFAKDMPFRQVVEELKNAGSGGKGVVKILVKEGLTIDQIAAVVEKSTGRPAKEFLKAAGSEELVNRLVKDYPALLNSVAQSEGVLYVLEGYLFPATYEYNLSDKNFEQLITAMVAKTDEVLKPLYSDISASGHSVNEIMTMASLIEKEGNNSEDRKLISSVFWNRINQDMAIQSDISVLYALGEHKEVVTYEDLEVDSPYNLYKYNGLAPGPMNSPSEEAIIAALQPTESDYLYFFANIKNGKVYFTNNFDEHLAWQEEYKNSGTVNGE